MTTITTEPGARIDLPIAPTSGAPTTPGTSATTSANAVASRVRPAFTRSISAPSPAIVSANDGGTTPTTSNGGTGTPPAYKVPKFLRSLYAILQSEDSTIVAWVQNQELKPNRVTAFHILNMERFEQEILPKYFKHQKFASFQRQLNNFGFRKWTKTQSSGVCTFSHNCFPPDPQLIGVMRASLREQWRQKHANTSDGGEHVGGSAITGRKRSNSASGLKSRGGKEGKSLMAPTAAAIKAAAAVAPMVDNLTAPPPIKTRLKKSTISPARVPMKLPQQAQSTSMPVLRPHGNELINTNSRSTELPTSMWPSTTVKSKSQQQQQPQPQLPLIRPSLHEMLEVSEDLLKPFALPPLQPQPSSSSSTSSSYPIVECSVNFANFPSHSSTFFELKPIELMEKHSASAMDICPETILEPWAWENHAAASCATSNLEFGVSFPFDLDWQATDAAATSIPNHHHHQHHRHLQQPNPPAPPTHGGASSKDEASEFGLDNLLFVE